MTMLVAVGFAEQESTGTHKEFLPIPTRSVHLDYSHAAMKVRHVDQFIKFKESFDRLVWLLDRVRDKVPNSENSARMAIAQERCGALKEPPQTLRARNCAKPYARSQCDSRGDRA
jgi:hypothetical protein